MNYKFLALAIVLVLAIGLLAPMAFAGKPTKAPRAAKACDDGLDNDGDGYTDYPSDPGCSSKNDKSELNPAIECDDGSDNDGDGDTDMDDAGCSSPTDNDETNCGDGVCEGGETSGNCPADCGYPDSCGDTDDGNVITVFGTASGYLNNSPYSNDDYCVDSSNIMEYYCSGDYEQSQQQSCGTDFYGEPYCSGNDIYKYMTDYFCASGECDSDVTPVFQEDCDSYDNYGDNYCMNGSVYRDNNDYFCSSGTCNYTSTPELVEACQWGCTNAACNPRPDECFDTDGGIVEFVFGTVSGYSSGSPYSYDDYCINNATLNEYYCSETQPSSFQTNCADLNASSVCVSGACV